MSGETRGRFPAASRGRETLVLALLGIAALAPYVLCRASFLHLYWFGDEFDLVDQFDRMGFWSWVWTAFAENFVPLFKVLWGGAVYAFGGSYAAMIAIGWVLHGLNVALLGRLMRTCGLAWAAVLLAQIVFGLTVTNHETLAWSVQFSATLSVTFLLLGLDSVLASSGLGLPLGCSLASGLSFSRGVLTGPLLALASFFSSSRSCSQRLAKAALLVLPAVLVAGLIFFLARGNQHAMGGHIKEAAVFGTWYFCLNPLHSLFGVESWGWRTTVILGAAKLVICAWALLRSSGRGRILFIALILFDLGNSLLMGIGRYHTGLGSTVSSRYQYAALVSFMPLAGFAFSSAADSIGLRGSPRRFGLAAGFVALAVGLCLQWPSVIGPFADQRGTQSRHILLVESNPPPNSVPGIPAMSVERARELIQKYNLR